MPRLRLSHFAIMVILTLVGYAFRSHLFEGRERGGFQGERASYSAGSAKAQGATSENCPAHFLNNTPPQVDESLTRGTQALCFTQFAVLYSPASKTPLWSAEHLTRDIVAAARGIRREDAGNPFHADERLAAGSRAELSDFARSGYDRGHMSPDGDMGSVEAKRESFSLANMIPQHPCNNEGIWAGIESAVRKWATSSGEVYIVTGPIFPAGAPFSQIGRGVLVPPQIFKAVYDPASNAAGVYVTPNTDGADWQALTINQLHELAGVDPFPTLTAAVKSTPVQLPPPDRVRYGCRLHQQGG